MCVLDFKSLNEGRVGTLEAAGDAGTFMAGFSSVVVFIVRANRLLLCDINATPPTGAS